MLHAASFRRAAFGRLMLWTALAATFPAGARGQSQQALPRDGYRIDATLYAAPQRVDGRASITWKNRSQKPLHSLLFHLYANAFAGEHTVFMREHGPRLRGTALDRRGGIDVLSLRTGAGVDLLPRAHTDLVPDDATQMRVDLPAPLAPGETIELEVVFRVRLPSIVARMGVEDDFFMIAQWFPKLAKLEADGRWASFPYHGLGEFYADFADYDLTLHVPERYTVAAPGTLQARAAEPNGMRRERYVLRNAIDVAWAASPRLLRTGDDRGPLRIDVFAPAGHVALARQQAELLRSLLRRFDAMLGPYPYGRLVLVLPPAAAIGAAGMEYPGLIVGWTARPFTELDPVARVLHDVVSAHELAHQWFALLLASNEVEAPLLDEGLAEWSGLDALRERYGRAFFARWTGLPLDLFEGEHAAYASAAPPPSSLEPAYRYRARELGLAVYVRPSLTLETIARTWGLPRLRSTLGAYARAQRFAHPTPPDLWRAFDAGYWTGFSRQVLRPALQGVVPETALGRDRAGHGLRAAREGALALPEQIALVGARGTKHLPWPADERTRVLPAVAGLLGVAIDPERHNLLDRARADDQLRTAAGGAEPPLLARVLLWVQACLWSFGP